MQTGVTITTVNSVITSERHSIERKTDNNVYEKFLSSARNQMRQRDKIYGKYLNPSDKKSSNPKKVYNVNFNLVHNQNSVREHQRTKSDNSFKSH
jgi:hypothetical protein